MYATVADLIKRFAEEELFELTNSMDVLNEEAILLALSDASSTMDGYIRVRHSVATVKKQFALMYG